MSSNKLNRETDRASLRPLELEAQKALLRMQADDRWIDAFLSGEKRKQIALGEPPSEKGATGPVQMLQKLIEERSADGEDTHIYEMALRSLGEAEEEA